MQRVGGEYLVVLVQASMCSRHEILIVHYFRLHVYFDFVHQFLQLSGTVEAVFISLHVIKRYG